MFKIEELIRTTRFSLRAVSGYTKSLKAYVFLHDLASTGKKVGILPFRTVNEDYHEFEYMLHSEIIPCWSMSAEKMLFVSGGTSQHDSMVDLAIDQFNVLTGYEVNESQLISLGNCRVSRYSDTICHLYTLDLTNVSCSSRPASDDVKWVYNPTKSLDPLVSVAYWKLKNYLYEL